MPIEHGTLTQALVIGALAFLMAVLLVPLLSRTAARCGLLDLPGGHKCHEGAVPVVGGIAIVVAGMISILTVGPALRLPHWIFLVSVLFLMAVGVIDDRSQVNPRLRLLLQALVVTITFVVLGFKVDSLGNLFGFGAVELGVLAVPFGILATVALINAFNMLDGLDGLAGSVAVIALVAICALALDESRPLLLAVAAGGAGATLGFLMFNLPLATPRKHPVFMGDAGSTVLGFAIACLCMGLQVHDLPGSAGFVDIPTRVLPVELLWLVAIPVFEILTTTLRRAWAKASPMQADNGHYHHRLRDAGYSVRTIFLIYLLFSIAMMLIGLTLHTLDVPEVVTFGGFLVCYGLWHRAMVGASRRAQGRESALQAVGPG